MTRSTFRRPDVVAVMVLAVAALLTLGAMIARSPSSSTPLAVAAATTTDEPSTVLERPTQTTALWLGDDFTAGVGRIDNASYARIVCLRMGWACNVDAQGSTGFLNDGAAEYDGATSRLADRLDFDKATFDSDVVVVDAGRNDLEVDSQVLLGAIDQYVKDVRAGWPNARIVIIVPTFMSPEKYDDYDALVDGITAISSKVGGQVLDPIALGWYAGVDIPSMQIDDRVHPNAVGNAYLAGVIEGDLRDLGLDRITAQEGA